MPTNKNAPHPDVTDVPEGAKRVAPHEGHEYGYWGASPDTHDRRDYTVDGVTDTSTRNPGPTEHVPESPRQRQQQGGQQAQSSGGGETGSGQQQSRRSGRHGSENA